MRQSDTSRELDEMCARAVGWTWRDDRAYSPSGSVCSRVNGDPWWWLEPYSADHTTARLLEDEIERRALQEQYIDKLLHIVDATPNDEDWRLWQVLRATPEQRARAFLDAMQVNVR